MDIIYDAETAGGFNQHHPDFKVLFVGLLCGGRLIQTDDKEKIMQFLQEKKTNNEFL